MTKHSRLLAFRCITRSVWFVLVLLTSILSFAQTESATMSGTVMDRSGAVVAEAKIEVTNSDTNIKSATTTNKSGIYVVTGLRPGRYRMSVSKEGFRSIVVTDITLNVQDVVSRNFNLDVGAFSESITVTADALNVNTTDASVSTVIDRKFVESLPLNGRSFNTLLQLTPGVVIAQASGGSPGQFSIAGQRTDANNFLVDGVSANFGVASTLDTGGSGSGTAQAFSALGGTSSLVSVDALQEFRIETSSFAPEFGRSPGGQIILTTRSGTNGFHGGVFDYFRNTVMDANDWFNNAAIPLIPRAPEHHNDFGGYLGGPIWKDKTFFFFSYEGARLTLPQTNMYVVPSKDARTNAPAALAPFLNAFPLPNGPVSADDFTAQLTGSFSNRATLDATSIRIDHNFNDRFSIFGRYNNAPSAITDRHITIPSNPGNTAANTQTLTLGLNMLLTTQVSNTLRGNYSRQSSGLAFAQDSFGGAVPVDPKLLLGTLRVGSNLSSFRTFDTSLYILGTDAANRTRQLNFVDDLSWSLGTHQLKFGADYRAIYLDKKPFQNELLFLTPTVQGFLSTGQMTLFAGSAKPAQTLAKAFSLYGQDTWKINPKLTLTYGLRWELSPAPSARDTTTLAAWTNVNNPAQLALAPLGTPLWNTTYGNFAPRFGIAYSFTDRGDFVVRAGGGVFYDLGVGQAAALGTSFPNFAFGSPATAPLPLIDATPFLPTLSRQPPFPYFSTLGYSPDLKLPRSYQWNVALEKSFGGRQTISATYVGQAGRDLLRREDLFQPNSNFAGVFQLWQEDARSNYNALQVQYRRPLSSRLQALLNYTWSHSLDNTSNDSINALSNTIISAANDYASSDFDVRHSFSGAITYAIPGVSRYRALSLLTKDWSLDTVVVARSGFPFNGLIRFVSPDPSGLASSRPDRVPGQPVYLYGTQCAQVFGPPPQGNGALLAGQSCPGGKGLNPAAFSVPSTVRQGTEGRNDIPGFGLTQIDLSIGRRFPITEKVNLQFRADAFNLFNHPNFANPFPLIEFGPSQLLSGSMLNQGLGGLNSLFQEGGPRSLQLSLKLSF
jgi:hypothetical protein